MFSERTNWNKEQNSIINVFDELKKVNKSVIDLTKSNPTQCGIEYPESEITDALVSAKNLSYKPDSKGSECARQIVVDYYKQKNGILDVEQIILTASTSEGYSYLFRLLANVKDEVLFPTPSYPLFSFLMDLNDVKMVCYPLIYVDGWQIDIKTLEESITSHTKALVFVNPNNPTGSYISKEEIEGVNALCKKNNLAIICDEVFFDFYFGDENEEQSLIQNDQVLTFVLGGLSKMLGMPQMKISWIAVVGEKKLREEALKRLEIIADTYLSVNTPSQNALKQWFDQKNVIQEKILARIRSNLSQFKELIKDNDLISMFNSQGGWYVVVRILWPKDDEDLVLTLLKKDCVFIHPGYFYDFTKEGCFVISLLPENDVFCDGIKRILTRLADSAG